MSALVLQLVQPSQLKAIDPIIASLDGKPLTRFPNDLWDFSPLIDNLHCKRSDKQIDFNMKLPDSSILTHPIHSDLLMSVKGFIYARLTRPHPRTGKVLKARTATGIWFRLRPLLNWMNTNKIPLFSAITPTVAARYAKHVKSLGFATNTQLKYLSVLEMLHQFTGHYLDGVKQDPWPESSSTGISGDTKSSSKQTDIIPDTVFQKLGTKS